MSLSVTEALLIVIRMQHVSIPLEVMGVYAILGTLEMDSHVWVRLSAAIVNYASSRYPVGTADGKFCCCFFLRIDTNECELRISNCDVNANCSNTFGSFECTCSAGFVGDGVNCTSKDLHCHTSICKVYDVY